MADPPNWRDLDGIRGYDEFIAEMRRRFLDGEPVHELPMFQPRQTVAALYVDRAHSFAGNGAAPGGQRQARTQGRR